MNKSGGYIVILLTLIFMAISLIMVLGGAVPIMTHYSSVNGFVRSKQAFGVAQSGADEALFRLKNGKNMPMSLDLALGDATSTVTVTSIGDNKKILINGTDHDYERNFEINLLLGTGISFHYGIQSGNGGFELGGNSSSYVSGNVFSNGPIIATGQGNIIRGSAVSAGPSGLLRGIHATSTGHAHTIEKSTVDRDAFYQVISESSVGTPHPNSPDQPQAGLPISDDQISDWEDDADITTVLCTGGSYSPPNGSVLGPVKIPCNLSIKGMSITIGGPVWVTGNIDIKGSTIQMDNDLEAANVAIIADDPSNRISGSTINSDTTSAFYAAGCPAACVPGAFVFLISQNNNEELNHNGAVQAVSLGQGSSGVVAYASHGLITVGQQVNLKEVTAYKITLSQGAQVTYDTGLGSSLFDAGPGGGYDLVNWFEY